MMSILGNNFAEHVAHYAMDGDARIAIVENGERKISYLQLNQRANQLAAALRDTLSVVRGDRVACELDNCAELLVIFLACSKIGAIFVPLQCFGIEG